MRNYFKVTARGVRTPIFFNDHDAADTLRAHEEASELAATYEREGIKARISIWSEVSMLSGIQIIGSAS